MDQSPPTKPPRGVKSSKETSGLLMSVIKTLSASESNEQRDQERMKLELEYKKVNQQLEQLVSLHHDDLTRVMNLFGRISSLISQARHKVRSTKESLITCKTLLTGRREELKKLWLESLEYKHILLLLKEIEEIKEVPSRINNHISQKQYLPATQLLISTISACEETLKDVAGLQELNAELFLKKQELYTKIMDELREQIYVRCTCEVIQLKRQGSARDSEQHTPAMQRLMERRLSPRPVRIKAGRTLFPNQTDRDNSKFYVGDAVEFADDAEYVVENLVESIIILKRVSDFSEEIKQNTQKELVNLTLRTTKELSASESPNLLLEFFQVLTDQFKRIIEIHKFIVDYLKEKCDQMNVVFTLADVWLKMQLVIQQLVSDYLDVKEIDKTEQQNLENGNCNSLENVDISLFFTRKKHQRVVKGSLFKFGNVGQKEDSNNINSKVFDYEVISKENLLLCKPSPAYITQIYVPLSRFSEEIETLVNGPSEEPSTLSQFLSKFVGTVFLGTRYEEVAASGTDAGLSPVAMSKPSPLMTGSAMSILRLAPRQTPIRKTY